MSLAKWVAPLRGGEERIQYTSEIPGATRKDIVRALCEKMTEMAASMLARTDWIDHVVMPPTVFRETITGDGIDRVVITIGAIVVRTDESRERFVTLHEQQADDDRRYRALADLVGREDEMSREEFLAEAAKLGFGVRKPRLATGGVIKGGGRIVGMSIDNHGMGHIHPGLPPAGGAGVASLNIDQVIPPREAVHRAAAEIWEATRDRSGG